MNKDSIAEAAGGRVKALRKSLGLTLEKFGDRLGVKKSALSQIENGRNGLSDQMRTSICREFGVREAWLADGEGEMMEQGSDLPLDEFIRQHHPDELELKVMRAWFELDPDIRSQVLNHLRERLGGGERGSGADGDGADRARGDGADEDGLPDPVAPAQFGADADDGSGLSVEEAEALYKKSVLSSAPGTGSAASSTTGGGRKEA